MNEEEYRKLFTSMDQELRALDVDIADIETATKQVASLLSMGMDVDDDAKKKIIDWADTYWDMTKNSLAASEIDRSRLNELAQMSLYLEVVLGSISSPDVPTKDKRGLVKYLSKNLFLAARAAYSSGHKDGYLQSRVDVNFSGIDLDFLTDYKGEDES